MNIFVLDTEPEKAAEMHMDKHVVKMCVEYAQILATAARLMGFPNNGYRDTHQNHPCVRWAAEDIRHWSWLHRLLCETAKEYTKRYGKTHKSYVDTQQWLQDPSVSVLRQSTLRRLPTPSSFVLAIPEELRGVTVRAGAKLTVAMYREYYHTKRSFATWKKPGRVPAWWQTAEQLELEV